MKLFLSQRSSLLTRSLLAALSTCASLLAQTDLPYSSGSTGADGPLTFRTIPTGGRYIHALAYDAARNRTVLFGGYNPNLSSGGALGDTWLFDGANWTQVNPATSPPRRYYARMVYVPWNGGELVLFGGQDQNNTRLNDTWVWNGVTWAQLSPPSSPSARYSPAMAYDAQHDKIVLFGGGGGGTDTWLFDGTTWSQPSTPTSPPAWDQAVAVFDGERKNVVLVDYDGTYLWDGANWTKTNPTVAAPQSGRAGIAYDPIRKEVLLFGGQGHNTTFAWNGVTWADQNPANSPPACYSTEMVFDPGQGKVILFGGQTQVGDSYSGDTWAWDGTNWSFVSGRTQFFDMTSRPTGVWNYTTINIPAGIAVQFIKNAANAAVRWLATGNVQVDGSLVLDGGFGDNNLPPGVGGAGGPGGYDGGHGAIRMNQSGSAVGSPGQGPGGGLPGTQAGAVATRDGKAALFATTPGGYGNIYLQPLLGGSGGGGGSSSDTTDGGSGGGGGGAIMIASSRDIVINGTIFSRGGQVQYSGASLGGRGSGGGILLRADRISGSGSIDATPDGRIRFEAYYRSLAGSTQPTSVNSAPVAGADFATTGLLTIASVKGANVQQPPSGNMLTPDVIFTDAGPVDIVVQASNVPNGTPVSLRITTVNGVITPPSQNINNNSVTFNVAVPKGIGTLQAFATFKIQ